MFAISDPALAALIGAFGGVLLGLAARLGRFCTLGAIEDALYGGNWGRIRMWAMALGLSIIGVFGAEAAGLIAIDQSIYALRVWSPLASIIGGLVFGYGMAISGNCGYGALARLGGGDMRSFVIVVVMGITAYMMINGPLASFRIWAFPTMPAETGAETYGFAHLIGASLGLPLFAPACAIGSALLIWALADRDFRTSRHNMVWSGAVALAIVSGWVGTTWIATEGFTPVQIESHSFTAPVGETMLWLMTSSGGGFGFAIGSVGGVLAGAVLGSVMRGHFRWEACDDARELGRQLMGGALMGIGAVTAVGCSVGQGLGAFATLAFSGPVVLASIVAGAALGLRHLIHGSVLPGFASR